MIGHRWRVAFSILVRDRRALDDDLLAPSRPDSVAFSFDAPTARDAIEMAEVKLQEYRRTRFHSVGEMIVAWRLVDVEWIGPESPGAAGDESARAAADDPSAAAGSDT